LESSGAYGEGRIPAAAEIVVGDGGASEWMLLDETEYLSGEGGLDELDPICTELRFPAAEYMSNIEFFRGRRFTGDDEAFGVALPLAVMKAESGVCGNARLGDLSRET
jgi:hypothetical protein